VTADEPPPEHVALMERVATSLVVRGLAAPAIFVLETMKPLSFVASQALVALEPFVQSVLSVPDFTTFRELLEDRRNVERLLQRIEALEDERQRAEGEARRPKRDQPPSTK
jgi:hypothetical protein